VGNEFTVHAEIDAFMTAQKDVKGCDIIVIRLSRENKLTYSRPCNCCIDKLKSGGINKVYYSEKDENISCEELQNMEKLHISSFQRMRNREKKF
jgi:deoxycytidylate deaminase